VQVYSRNKNLFVVDFPSDGQRDKILPTSFNPNLLRHISQNFPVWVKRWSKLEIANSKQYIKGRRTAFPCGSSASQ